MAGTCECDNGPSCFLRCRELFDLLRNGQLLRKDYAPCSRSVKPLAPVLRLSGLSSVPPEQYKIIPLIWQSLLHCTSFEIHYLANMKFTLEYGTKTQRGSESISLLFYLGARGSGWLTPRPGRCTPGNEPVTIV